MEESTTVQFWDIVTAFLHAPLDVEAEVYIRGPPEMPSSDGQEFTHLSKSERKIYRVRKALYGMRASPKLFQDHLANILLARGFNRCKADSSVFHNPDTGVMLVDHVDDCAVKGKTKEVNKLYDSLQKDLKMKKNAALNRPGDSGNILIKTVEVSQETTNSSTKPI
jgi:hypothetical protein